MTLINRVSNDIGNISHSLIHITVGINDGGKDDFVFSLFGSTEESMC